MEINKKTDLYLKEKLFEDLQNFTKSSEICQDKSNRDCIYKLKVLQTIFGLTIPELVLSENEDNFNEIKNAIKNYVECDEVLYGYTFYVSSNQVFDYSWSYLRKQMNKYVDFLFNANLFFHFVLRDINALSKIFANKIEYHIVFNEMIDVEYLNEDPFVRANMLWENFHNITRLGKGYQLSLMLKETTVAVITCNYKDSVESLCKKVQDFIL